MNYAEYIGVDLQEYLLQTYILSVCLSFFLSYPDLLYILVGV